MNSHVRRRAAIAVLTTITLTAVLVPLAAVRSDAAPLDPYTEGATHQVSVTTDESGNPVARP